MLVPPLPPVEAIVTDDERLMFQNAEVMLAETGHKPITDAASCEEVRGLMVEINTLVNQIDNSRAAAKKAYWDAGKVIDAEAKKYIDPLEKMVKTLKVRLADYAMEVERVRRLAEMERLAKEMLADQEAVASGRTPKLVTDVHIPEAAAIQTREAQEILIVRPEDIPRSFLMPDMDKIKAAIKAGVMVPGVEVRIFKQVIAK